MRHRVAGNRLSRTTSHRRAVLANLTISLIEYKKVKTTLVKAKEARKFAERMITFAKKGTVAARRHVYSKLNNKQAVKTLFDEISGEYANRNGGYTRIVKLGERIGDGASMAYLELVGYEGVKKEKKVATTKKKEKGKKASDEEEAE
ncbi:50S ribosomal protein L17 [candidate division KSB1 bacterium]|nr:50S ribosomal protein L17 [candidate division KSB1 bacterium]